MSRIRTAVGVLFTALVILVLYLVAGGLRDAHYRDALLPWELLSPQEMLNKQAPAFTLADREGKSHRLDDYRGRPVVLNFWSLNCPPCREELPQLVALDRIGRERKSFSVVTICAEEDWAEVSKLLPPTTSMLVLSDPDQQVTTKAYGTHKFPETYLIDGSGQLRARFDGPRPWSNPVVVNLIEAL
jgi:peroxiredoxin